MEDSLTSDQLRRIFIEAGASEELLTAIQDERPSDLFLYQLYLFAKETNNYASMLHDKLVSAKKQSDEAVIRSKNSDDFAKKLRLDNERQMASLCSFDKSERKMVAENESLKRKCYEAKQTARATTALYKSSQLKTAKLRRSFRLIKGRFIIAKRRSLQFSKSLRKLKFANSQKVDAQTTEIATLTNQLQTKTRDWEAKEADFARQLWKKDNEVAQLVSDATAHMEQLRKEKGTEISNLRTELKKKDDESKRLSKQCGELQSKLDEATAELKKKESESVKLSEQCQELQAKFDELSGDLAKKEQSSAKYSKRCEFIQGDLEKAKTDLKSKEAELANIAARCSQLESKLADAIGDLKKAKTEADTEREKLKAMTKKAAKLEYQSTEFNATKNTLSQEKARLTALLLQTSNERERLRPENEQLRAENEQLRKQLAESNEMNAVSVKESATSVTSTSCADNPRLMEQLALLATELKKEQEKAKSLEAAKVASVNEREKLVGQLATLTTEMASEQEKRKALESVSASNWQKVFLLQAENSDLKSQCQTKLAELQSLKKSTQMLADEVEQLKGEKQLAENVWRARLKKNHGGDSSASRQFRISHRTRLHFIRDKVKLKRELFKFKRRSKGGISQLALSKRIHDRKDKLIDWLKKSLSTKTKRIDDLERENGNMENRLSDVVSSQVSLIQVSKIVQQ